MNPISPPTDDQQSIQAQVTAPLPEVRCPVCYSIIPPGHCFPRIHCPRCGWTAT